MYRVTRDIAASKRTISIRYRALMATQSPPVPRYGYCSKWLFSQIKQRVAGAQEGITAVAEGVVRSEVGAVIVISLQ